MPTHECMIIADPKGKAWGFACSIYKKLNAIDNKYYLSEFQVKRFIYFMFKKNRKINPFCVKSNSYYHYIVRFNKINHLFL